MFRRSVVVLLSVILASNDLSAAVAEFTNLGNARPAISNLSWQALSPSSTFVANERSPHQSVTIQRIRETSPRVRRAGPIAAGLLIAVLATASARGQKTDATGPAPQAVESVTDRLSHVYHIDLINAETKTPVGQPTGFYIHGGLPLAMPPEAVRVGAQFIETEDQARLVTDLIQHFASWYDENSQLPRSDRSRETASFLASFRVISNARQVTLFYVDSQKNESLIFAAAWDADGHVSYHTNNNGYPSIYLTKDGALIALLNGTIRLPLDASGLPKPTPKEGFAPWLFFMQAISLLKNLYRRPRVKRSSEDASLVNVMTYRLMTAAVNAKRCDVTDAQINEVIDSVIRDFHVHDLSLIADQLRAAFKDSTDPSSEDYLFWETRMFEAFLLPLLLAEVSKRVKTYSLLTNSLQSLRWYAVGFIATSTIALLHGMIVTQFMDKESATPQVIGWLAGLAAMIGPPIPAPRRFKTSGLRYLTNRLAPIVVGFVTGDILFNRGSDEATIVLSALEAAAVLIVGQMLVQVWSPRRASPNWNPVRWSTAIFWGYVLSRLTDGYWSLASIYMLEPLTKSALNLFKGLWAYPITFNSKAFGRVPEIFSFLFHPLFHVGKVAHGYFDLPSTAFIAKPWEPLKRWVDYYGFFVAPSVMQVAATVALLGTAFKKHWRVMMVFGVAQTIVLYRMFELTPYRRLLRYIGHPILAHYPFAAGIAEVLIVGVLIGVGSTVAVLRLVNRLTTPRPTPMPPHAVLETAA